MLDSGKPMGAAADPPEALRWRGSPSGWHVAALSLPRRTPATPTLLAVFSRFHSPQFDGDQVYRLEMTGTGWRYGKEVPETETNGYRVRDHQLTAHFDLPHSGAVLTDSVTVQRLASSDAPCLLRLSCDMHVDRLLCGDRPLPARCVPGLIAVLPPPGKRFTLSLEYHRVLNPAGGDTILPTGVVLGSYWYPHIARLPARCGLTVTVPSGWTAVGQGDLLRRSDGAAGGTFTFRNRIPTCYFFLVAGPYTLTSRTVQGRRLTVCQLRPDPVQASQALDQLGRALAFFEARFGPFPYDHYELVETPGSGAALEAYSFAMFSGGDFGPLPHELAHTWWGGLVPNPYTRSLWSESFAEYSATLFARRTAGLRLPSLHPSPAFGRRLLRSCPTPIADAPDLSALSYSVAGYVKGPSVLMMLEDLLGEGTMMHCLRRFAADRVPGEASDWPDFARAVREVTGRDYGWFFGQWLHRPGVPQVGLTDVQVAASGGHCLVTARVVQAGMPYRLRLPVVVELAGGQRVRRTLDVAGPATSLTLSCGGVPLRLELDPEGTVLMAGIVSTNDPFSYTFPRPLLHNAASRIVSP